MEAGSSTPSIIERLMGLDDLPSQHPVQKRGKVLSEEYFQRVASIAARGKNSYVYRVRNEKPKVSSTIFGMSGNIHKARCHTTSAKIEKQSNASYEKVFPMESLINGCVSRKSCDTNENFSMPLGSHLNGGGEACVPGNFVVLDPCLKGGDGFVRDFCQLRHGEGHCADNGNYKQIQNPVRRSQYQETNQLYRFCDEIEPVGTRSMALKGDRNGIEKDLRRKNDLFGLDNRRCGTSLRDPQLSDRKIKNHSLVCSPEDPFVGRKEKGRFLKCQEKINDCFTSGYLKESPTSGCLSSSIVFKSPATTKKNVCRCSRGPESSHDAARSRYIDDYFGWRMLSNLRKSASIRENSEFFLPFKRENKFFDMEKKNNASLLKSEVTQQELKDRSDKLFLSGNSRQNSVILQTPVVDALFRDSSILQTPVVDALFRDSSIATVAEEVENGKWFSQNNNSKPDGTLSSCSQDSLEQEEDSVSLSYSSVETVSFKSLEENQPSPDSVLDPCSISADPFGDGLQLHLLKFESSESCSQVSEVTASSNDDEECSLGISKEKKETRSLIVDDDKDFRYIDDVMTEAGLHGCNLVSGLVRWHSLDCPISCSVFEALEKRYWEEKSWKRSERRFLFDKINVSLVKVLHTYMHIGMTVIPVSLRIGDKLSCVVTVETLREFLVQQDRENDFESLDFGECIDSIVTELERLIIDELVGEVISI